MKTLHIIQVLSKIGKILSKIAFICCLVGFCICFVGFISLAMGIEALKLGSVTLKSILNIQDGVTTGTVYAAMAAGMILCAGEAVLAKFAEHYFKRELADGTPFCLEGAKEMRRLGILTICIPLATQTIAEIVQTITAQNFQDVVPLELNSSGSVALGIMFLVVSLICQYGAEQHESMQ